MGIGKEDKKRGPHHIANRLIGVLSHQSDGKRVKLRYRVMHTVVSMNSLMKME